MVTVSGGDDKSTELDARGPAVAKRLYLVVMSDGEFDSHLLPEAGEVTIGRGTSVEIRIDRDSISRRHTVVTTGARLTITDLGSANGTWVRDQRIAPNEPVAIAPGEAFEIGKTMVVVQRRAADDASRTGVQVDVGGSMTRLEHLVTRVASSSINIILNGETGAGKEVFAERIHAASKRADRPLVRLNCAAFSETLLESELFGHERGAFTGAVAAKPGLLESAEGGTVFLDEIGDLSLPLQAKLLRVLEERKVLRVGALKPRAIDVRFIAATHRSLPVEVEQGRFRQDLYFRLNGITLVIPPLRERLDEIEGLARGFAERFATSEGRPKSSLTSGAIARLKSMPWPGNVRELKNVVERAVLMAPDDVVDVEHLIADPTTSAEPAASSSAPDLRSAKEEAERRTLAEALERANGNQTQAAKLLGIGRRTLIEKLERYGMPRPRKGR